MLKLCCETNLNNPMKRQALVASTLVALGVATGSLLAPQAASALDFTFSFGGAEGLIQNLIDNQINACDGTDSCVVKVINNGGNAAALGTYVWVDTPTYGGFTVSSGVINEARWRGAAPLSSLSFWDSCVFPGFVGCGAISGSPAAGVPFTGTIGPVAFAAVQSPSSSVPGPLPLFGATAAFGFSRKLRNRITFTRTTAPTRPAD